MKNDRKDRTNQKKQSRLGFLIAGFGLMAALLLRWRKEETKPSTVKFLSQDGSLVEVDITKLQGSGRQASKEEIQNWVKR